MRQTGDAQLKAEGSMTSVINISLRISSSASLAANGVFCGACWMGLASPVSMSCLRMRQNLRSAYEVENVSL